jgi:hypothetical protein
MGQQARARREYQPPPPTQQEPPAPQLGNRKVWVDELAKRMTAHIDGGQCRDAYDLARLAGELAIASHSAELCPIK